MSILSLVLPVLNKPDSTEDPKIITAFTTIQNLINGNLDSSNVKTLEATTVKAPATTYVAQGSIFTKASIKENETTTWTNPSSTRPAFLNISMAIRSETARGESAQVLVAGVNVSSVFANENNGTYYVGSPVAVYVGPSEVVTIKCLAGGGSTKVETIEGSYRLL